MKKFYVLWGMFMLRVLLMVEDSRTRFLLERSARRHSLNMEIVEINRPERLRTVAASMHFDCFVLSLEEPFCQSTLSAVFSLRMHPDYAFTPLVFISKNMEFFSMAHQTFHCLDFLLRPISGNSFDYICGHLKRSETTLGLRNYLDIQQGRTFLHIPILDIIFIETFGRKVLIHTRNKDYPVYYPLKSLELACINSGLVRCHRCYLANVWHIEEFKKDTDPWELTFQNYPLTAYVSRNYVGGLEKELRRLLPGQTQALLT